MKKKLFILKLGGSVITQKGRSGAYVRKKLISDIAKEIRSALKKGDFQLILIHGAGSVGHQLAHKYGLKAGAGRDERKWRGSIISRVANQKLNTQILEILVENKLPVVSAHTPTILVQKNKQIADFNLSIIQEALRSGCIPLLYGEMVFDRKLGMTICSGDAIAAHLINKMPVEKVFFGSDIDGLFDKDPHLNKNVKLIEKIELKNVFSGKIKLSQSHNIDTTGGISGKLKSFKGVKSDNSSLREIVIFNGLKKGNYRKVLTAEKLSCTRVVS